MRPNLTELRTEISAHPWRSVVLASAAGACVALARSRNLVVRATADAAVAAALAIVRELFLEQTRRFTTRDATA